MKASLFGGNRRLLFRSYLLLVAGLLAVAFGLQLAYDALSTADAVRDAGITKVGLLGTKFTMEQDFYRGRLEERGLEVIVPVDDDRDFVHRVIYDELCLGEIVDESRSGFEAIIAKLVRSGAEGVILGCTEIGLLVTRESSSVPVFDTTYSRLSTSEIVVSRVSTEELKSSRSGSYSSGRLSEMRVRRLPSASAIIDLRRMSMTGTAPTPFTRMDMLSGTKPSLPLGRPRGT